MTINGRVFQLLADQKRKQKELADYIEVNERNVSTWKDRGSDPPARLCYKIAEFFGVSVEWLLTGEEHPVTSFVNNGSVTGTMGHQHGAVIIRNGGERVLSEECAELVRIYESLGVKKRMHLLSLAFEVEEGAAKEAAGGNV